jgi:hypothetical protein
MSVIKTDFADIVTHVEAGGAVIVGIVIQKGSRPIEEFPEVLQRVREGICSYFGAQSATIGLLTLERANDKEHQCTVIIPRHITDREGETDMPSYFQ